MMAFSSVVACKRFFKRIQINYYQVNFRNIVLLHFINILQYIAPAENAAKHCRVQRFYPSAQDRRIGGKRFYRYTGNAQIFYKFLCAAGGVNGYFLAVQLSYNRL